jgi:hypothetical protein
MTITTLTIKRWTFHEGERVLLHASKHRTPIVEIGRSLEGVMTRIMAERDKQEYLEGTKNVDERTPSSWMCLILDFPTAHLYYSFFQHWRLNWCIYEYPWKNFADRLIHNLPFTKPLDGPPS